ncbi:MAG: N-acetyl-gamma-glutamyl-phosphate reductase [Halobacteriales archaeon]
MTATASVIGGSGYTGGELVRLLLDHPEIELRQVTSRSKERRQVSDTHPNLRGRTDLRFTSPEDLDSVDVLYAATPHGYTMEALPELREHADLVVDLSGDYRLDDPALYDEWYDEHPNPDLLDEVVYGVPELRRDEIRDAEVVAAAGCNATAALLALQPLDAAELVETSVVLDVKTSSSAGGATASTASHHAERSGVVRPYAPAGHRHQAEVEMETDLDVHMTVHAIDMVRGLSVTAHTTPREPPEEKELWKAYRGAYSDEDFVRVVRRRRGVYRLPEPKVVVGTNYADVGFAFEEDRVVSFCAIDNMMKGAAGQAVQCTNVALDLPETTGLEHPGLHPV